MFKLEMLRDEECIQQIAMLFLQTRRSCLPVKFWDTNTSAIFSDKLSDYLRFHSHDFFLIVDENKKRQGFISTYDYRIYDSSCKIMLCSAELDNNSLIKVTREFCNKLFQEYPLRNLFVELQVDDPLRAVFISLGFKKECILKEYYFCDGYYVDCMIMKKKRLEI